MTTRPEGMLTSNYGRAPTLLPLLLLFLLPTIIAAVKLQLLDYNLTAVTMLLGMCDPFSLPEIALLCKDKCQHDEAMRVSYGVVYCCFASSSLRNLYKTWRNWHKNWEIVLM